MKWDPNEQEIEDILKSMPKHKAMNPSKKKDISLAIQQEKANIQQTQQTQHTKKRINWAKWGSLSALAACVLLVFVLTFQKGNIFNNKTPGGSETKTTQPSKSINNPPSGNGVVTKQNQGQGTTQTQTQPTTQPQVLFKKTSQALLLSKDGGVTWSNITPAGISMSNPETVLIANNQSHVMVASLDLSKGKVTVYTSLINNQKMNWSTSTVSGAFIASLTTLQMTNQGFGYLFVGNGGAMGSEGDTLYTTQDNGTHWKQVSTAGASQTGASKGAIPLAGTMKSISFIDQQAGFITGTYSGNSLYLYSTHDGGKTWTQDNLTIPKGYTANGGAASTYPPQFINNKIGFLPVEFRNQKRQVIFYKTTDGGKTWQPTQAVNNTNFDNRLWQAIDKTHLITADNSNKSIFVSQDGGQTWHQSSITIKLDQLSMTNTTHGFASSGNSIYKTADGGKTWVKITK